MEKFFAAAGPVKLDISLSLEIFEKTGRTDERANG